MIPFILATCSILVIATIPAKHQKVINDIKKYGRAVNGRRQLIAHLKGERLTSSQRVVAMHYACCGWFADGKDPIPCTDTTCPLYPSFIKTFCSGKNPKKIALYDNPGETEREDQ